MHIRDSSKGMVLLRPVALLFLFFIFWRYFKFMMGGGGVRGITAIFFSKA